MQNKVCQQKIPFGSTDDIKQKTVVSDLLRKTRTEWWQHYQNGEGQDDASTNLRNHTKRRASLGRT